MRENPVPPSGGGPPASSREAGGVRGILLILLLVVSACSDPGTAPTYRVERRPFVHKVTAEGNLVAETTTALTVPDQVRRSVRLAWVAADGSLLEEGDLVARFDPTEMAERLEEGRSDLRKSGLEVDISRVENGAEVTGIELDLRVADLDLGHARRFQETDDALFSAHQIAESKIDQTLAAERKQYATDLRRTQESLAQTELDLLAIKERKARQSIDQARAGLSALEVRAPHAGILTLDRDWRGEVLQVGAEMSRGRQIGEIPDLSTMEAEVFVLEADAGGLEAGKPATVIVEAQPETVYAAQIRRVDKVAKRRYRGSPVQYFGVVLSFPRGTDGDFAGEPAAGVTPKGGKRDVTPKQGRRTMKPGQRVRATLILDQVDSALVVPRQAVAHEAGETWVLVAAGRVAGNSDFERRRVVTGASSLGLVVITGGLAEGELIGLVPAGAGGGETEDKESGDSPRLPVGSKP